MKNIIYFANNNGSDTRINKEIKTLSRKFDIIYLGCVAKNQTGNYSFCKDLSSVYFN